ncbi:Endolytic peptidoglycan transglycosylase RlpA [Commensalibacter sp. Nvir]|uniref:septal ring lytic transglycosylase RlpA family protein n=1 Tax=Commensalibacter sp. Nvir TaxID=3069817 RepID=UPI002D4E7317|nr:Endolytic peptidoglycan transglycosylase RlpA [Commensalibacter sp. Nvir]
MKRNYSKLIGLCFLTGLGLYPLNGAHASMSIESKRPIRSLTKKNIKSTRKRTHIRYLHRHKVYQPITSANIETIRNVNKSNEESGTASWYGGRHSHSRTFSGALFNKNSLTAAHPSLPMGTRVLVRSKDTGHAVIVVINDRGPFTGNRIIDLSKAAAAKIGMIKKGTAQVTITPIRAIEVAQAPN